MLLEIKKYPNPILRKKCEDVKEINEEIKKLIEDMIETMQKKQGIGLAAPQVGILKRVIVVQTEKGAMGFVNPCILKRSKEKEVIEEGCLSFPGLFLKIKRPKKVEVQALDGDNKKIKVQGLTAVVLQHEIDHLNGILFIDRISFWQRRKIKKRLQNLK